MTPAEIERFVRPAREDILDSLYRLIGAARQEWKTADVLPLERAYRRLCKAPGHEWGETQCQEDAATREEATP